LAKVEHPFHVVKNLFRHRKNGHEIQPRAPKYGTGLKADARAHLHTPLVFSVHETKGLEYPHVILYTLVSGQRAAHAEVCEGV
jgi:hypothetical protein